MTLRRLTVALTLMGGLGVWGFAYSGDSTSTGFEPVRAENAEGEGNHDEAEARYRSNQSVHWRHVAVGNYCSNR